MTRTAIPITVKELARQLIPRCDLESFSDFLLWPPNMFALTSAVLTVSGGYRRIVSPPPGEKWPPGGMAKWTHQVQEAAQKWTRAIGKLRLPEVFAECPIDKQWAARVADLPLFVRATWRVCCERMHAPHSRKGDIRDLCLPSQWKHLAAFVTMHAIADEASAGFGLGGASTREHSFALSLMRSGQHSLATIHQDRGRVLPKMHTPQVGITLQSISANLAFHRASVDVEWKQVSELPFRGIPNRPINCLLLPWPEEITAQDFTPLSSISIDSSSDEFGYFQFSPRSNEDMGYVKMLRPVLDAAEREVGKTENGLGGVDIVVLPEASMTASVIDDFCEVLKERGVKLGVMGVRKASVGNTLGENFVSFRYLSQEKGADIPEWNKLVQHKHHRWRLDRNQILRYHLGGALDPGKLWWEGIDVPGRKINFAQLGQELVFCSLLCEDLARQDPTAEVMRSVGPSLVFALLMDGPQYCSRWASLYASVLADDPGCSVLTLTSAGMVDRWATNRPGERRIVALWKDFTSPALEIELEAGATGILLSLCPSSTREWTADGREIGHRKSLVLGGIRQIRVRRGGSD